METIEALRQREDVPVVIANHYGLIVYVNKTFESVFGWTLAEIQQKPIATIIPSRLHDAHNLGFSRFILTGKPTLLGKPLQLPAIKKNGQEFKATHTICAEKINDHWMFGAMIKPDESAL